MWSNPGEIVFDPFGGVGSTVYEAVMAGRKGVMAEIKPSYFRQAKLNLADIGTGIPVVASEQGGLFDGVEDGEETEPAHVAESWGAEDADPFGDDPPSD